MALTSLAKFKMSVAAFLLLIFVLLLFEVNGTSLWCCPIYYLTGFPCPGCGLTRATLCLFRLEVVEAMHYNVSILFLFPLFCACSIVLSIDCIFKRDYLYHIVRKLDKLLKRNKAIYIAIACVYACFAVWHATACGI